MTPLPMTINTHTHYFPQTYIDLIAKYEKRCGTTVITDDKGVTFIQVGLRLRTGPIAQLKKTSLTKACPDCSSTIFRKVPA